MRTETDYRQQLHALLPPGPAWGAALAPGVAGVLAGLAPEFSRIDGRCADLLSEMDPVTVFELVPDWERVMGLPDPCIGAAGLFEDRQAEVRRRLVAVGEQTPDYFVRLAVSQGYPNAFVTEHRAPRFGRARFGRARYGLWAAQFGWTLHTGGRLRAGRRWGASRWGERFGINPGDALYCLVNRYAPAHTVVHIDYEDI